MKLIKTGRKAGWNPGYGIDKPEGAGTIVDVLPLMNPCANPSKFGAN